MTVLAVALLGGIGAVLRHLIGHWSARRGGWPRGTFLVNLSGSIAAGLLLGSHLDRELTAVLAAGFCGGFTTFSTWSVEVVELAEKPARRAAFAYGLGTVVACVGGALLGTAAVS